MCGKNMSAVSGHPGITFDILVVLKGKLSLTFVFFLFLPTEKILLLCGFFSLESACMEEFIVILTFQFYIFLLHTTHLFLKGELD